MKKIFKSLNDLFKSKDTFLAESVIENSIANMYRERGAYMPLYFTFKKRDVDLHDINPFYFRAETNEYRIVAYCNVSLHKYMPLAPTFRSQHPPVDVYVTIPTGKIRLINGDGQEKRVKSSDRIEDLITKAIYKSIQIEG